MASYRLGDVQRRHLQQ